MDSFLCGMALITNYQLPIYKKCYSQDLVYQIDGAKVGFPPLLLRIFICQREVLILGFQ